MDEFWTREENSTGEKAKVAIHDDVLASTRSPVQLTFGGCAGLFCYFLGVASSIQRHFHLDNVVFSGVSAGCFPAMLLALGVDVEEEFQTLHAAIIEDVRQHRFLALGKWIPAVKKHTLERLAPDAYLKVSGKFFCSLTQVPWVQNHLIGHFESNEDMVDCMLASGCVALYHDQLTYDFRGKKFVDGGLTSFAPRPFPEFPCHVLQFWHWRWMRPHWLAISTDADWTQQLFDWGKEDAEANLEQLEKVLTLKRSDTAEAQD